MGGGAGAACSFGYEGGVGAAVAAIETFPVFALSKTNKRHS